MENKVKLTNVISGYADLFLEIDDQNYYGYVAREPFAYYANFDTDEVRCEERWFPYLVQATHQSSYNVSFRNTGYKTRKEAIEAWTEVVLAEAEPKKKKVKKATKKLKEIVAELEKEVKTNDARKK